jgi:acyl transferase domain-containing protein
VGTLQMHGTGTALGDPIEVNAALAALLPAAMGRGAPAGGC